MPRADAFERNAGAAGWRRDAPVRIEVSGTVFEIDGLEAGAWAWAVERYGAFLSDRAADLHVTVAIGDAAADDDDGMAPTLTMTDERFVYRAGGYRLDGDLGAGRVRLVAPPLPTVLSPAPFRVLCSLMLLRTGGVMLHASAVVDHGVARVFCGPSESGKTTIAGLAGARPVLSDETIALCPSGDGYRACATPFFGEAGPVAAQTNTEAPLASLFFLRKSTRFAHRPLARREAAQRAFMQTFVPKRAPAVASALLGSLAALTAAVPCFELEFAARDALWSYVDAVA